jgi:predicted double-glycine peptidase
MSSSAITAILMLIVINAARSAPDSRGAKNFYDMQPSPSFISLGVHGYQQTFDYSCGPSSVMSLLHWYGALADKDMNRETEMRLMQGMHCDPNFGTRSQDMAAWLNDNGFDAEARVNGTVELLVGHLKDGFPVLVEWLDWGGHWVVLTGAFLSHDDRENTLFFADPAAHWFSVDNPSGISSFSASRFGDMVRVLCFQHVLSTQSHNFLKFWDRSNRTDFAFVPGIHVMATPRRASTT